MNVIIVQGVCSVLIDLVCASSPIILLRKARIKRKTKINLCILMGLGFVTAIASMVRTGFSYQIKSEDITWVGIPNAIARILEVNLGTIAACAPMMKPFYRYVRARIRGRHPNNIDEIHHSSSDLSFWHPSWFKPTSPSGALGKETPGREESDDVSAAIGMARTTSGIVMMAPEEERNMRAGERDDPRIPSMVFGTPFEMMPEESWLDGGD